MKKNMGTLDRVVRIALAVLIAVLIFTGQFTDLTAIIFGIVAVVFIATSAVGTCPAYLPFNISTRRRTTAR